MAFYIGKYNYRIKKSYEIEVVTPLFMSGADISRPELRAASIKGLLRFWWRAIHPIHNLDELKKRESAVFGSAMNDSLSKSPFSMFIETKKIEIKDKIAEGKKVEVVRQNKKFKIDIFTYLALGIYDPSIHNWSRKHIAPGSTFILHCMYTSEAVKDEVEKALSALIHYGGMGAKSRNGFGSVYSKDVPIIEFHKKIATDEAKYTSFSKKSQLFAFNVHNKWEDALSEIGIAYRTMRLSQEIALNKHDYGNRKYIALPIVQAKEEKVKGGRHAKTCFLHVNKTEEGKYQGQILVLPYKYQGPLADNGEYANVTQKMSGVLKKIHSGQDIQTIY